MRPALALCLSMMLLCAMRPSALAANDEDPEALIRQGVELRRKGDNVKARGYLKRAYQLARTPRSAAQLGLVELALNQFLESNLHLTEALADADDPWVRAQRKALESSREVSRSHLGSVQFSALPPGTTVKNGDGLEVAVPTDGVVWVAPGTTAFILQSPHEAAVTKTVTVAEGKTTAVSGESLPRAPVAPVVPPAPPTVEAPKVETPPPAVSVEPSRGRAVRTAGFVTAGVGAAALVAGVLCYRTATTKRNAILNATPTHTYDDSDLDWKSYDNAGVGLMIGGGIALAAGAALTIVGFRGEASSPQGPSVAVNVVPSGLSLSGTF